MESPLNGGIKNGSISQALSAASGNPTTGDQLIVDYSQIVFPTRDVLLLPCLITQRPCLVCGLEWAKLFMSKMFGI